MHTFIVILAAFCSAYCLVNFVGWQWTIKRIFKREGRLKPFDCVGCLSFWLTLLYIQVPALLPIGYAFITMYIATRIK